MSRIKSLAQKLGLKKKSEKANDYTSGKQSINSVMKTTKAEVLTSIKKLPDQKRAKLYQAFLNWFEYDEGDDDMQPYTEVSTPEKLVDFFMKNGDPISSLMDFFVDRNLMVDKSEDASAKETAGITKGGKFKQYAAELKAVGMQLTANEDDYQVKPIGSKKDAGYFDDDLESVYKTGMHMSKKFGKKAEKASTGHLGQLAAKFGIDKKVKK